MLKLEDLTAHRWLAPLATIQLYGPEYDKYHLNSGTLPTYQAFLVELNRPTNFRTHRNNQQHLLHV